jgi:hypothetical protein
LDPVSFESNSDPDPNLRTRKAKIGTKQEQKNVDLSCSERTKVLFGGLEASRVAGKSLMEVQNKIYKLPSYHIYQQNLSFN